jgi:thiol-disulfide isomerase/thioredoxin
MRWRSAAAALMWVSGAALALGTGELPPDLVAQDQSGVTQRPQDYRGRVLYIDFWASWCAPCLQELPALERLYADLAPRGFAVLAINVDARRSDAQRLLDRLQLSFPIVFDPDGVWPERFALPAMPSGYLIGRDGRVRHVQIGFREGDLAVLEQAIEQALEESP